MVESCWWNDVSASVNHCAWLSCAGGMMLVLVLTTTVEWLWRNDVSPCRKCKLITDQTTISAKAPRHSTPVTPPTQRELTGWQCKGLLSIIELEDAIEFVAGNHRKQKL